MIEYKNVTKTYGKKIALENVNLKIDEGEFVFLIGPSGAGKSTFTNLFLKVIDADSGNIFFKNYDVTKLSNRRVPLHRRSMGIIYQDFSLLPKKTIYENVAFAMEMVRAPKKQIKRQVPRVLSLVGLRDKVRNYPSELSIGEQQRVAIARAIVNNPDIVIADEPTGNLDPATGWEIMSLLEEINNQGTTVIMVTHSQEIVDAMQKRVVVIVDGKITSDKEIARYHVENINKVPEAASFIRRRDEFFDKPTELDVSQPQVEKIAERVIREAAQEKSPEEEEISPREKLDTVQKRLEEEIPDGATQFDNLVRDTFRMNKSDWSELAKEIDAGKVETVSVAADEPSMTERAASQEIASTQPANESPAPTALKTENDDKGKTNTVRTAVKAEEQLPKNDKAFTIDDIKVDKKRGQIKTDEDKSTEQTKRKLKKHTKGPVKNPDTAAIMSRFKEEDPFAMPDFLNDEARDRKSVV
jgi:cell division transport system ATP-binding protein